MKRLLTALLLCISTSALTAGWTATATVENIEIIRAQGFQINGAFGNPSNCSNPNSIFVSVDHPQYQAILATATAAFMANKKLYIFSHGCVEYGWHGGTFNELTVAGSIYLKH